MILKPHHFATAIVVLVTLALYARCLSFEFNEFDDAQYIVNNMAIQGGLSMASIFWAFTSLYASNWHPLTWLSHLLDIQLFGLQPWGHHLTSVLLHCLNAALLCGLLNRLTSRPWRSAAVAFLFAVHPLHVESVAFIAERKDLLSTLFGLLAIMAYCAYARHGGARRYLAVTALFTLSLMAKPMLVTLPFLLLLLDRWPLGRAEAATWQRLLIEKLPLLVLSGGSAIITVIAQHGGKSMRGITATALLQNSANALTSYTAYLGKTFLPVGLAPYYPYELGKPFYPVYLSALMLCGITAVTIRLRRSHPYLLFGWSWYLISLLPVIGIIQIGLQSMADRYTYVPLIGVFVMTVWGAAVMAERWHIGVRYVAVTGGLICLPLLTLTWQQIGYWRNNVTLFEHTLQVTEQNWFARSNLGVGLMSRGRNEEAIPHLVEALKIRPEMLLHYMNLGQAYMNLGNYPEAIEVYLAALEVAPESATLRNNLGKAYLNNGQPGLARLEFDKAANIGVRP